MWNVGKGCDGVADAALVGVTCNVEDTDSMLKIFQTPNEDMRLGDEWHEYNCTVDCPLRAVHGVAMETRDEQTADHRTTF